MLKWGGQALQQLQDQGKPNSPFSSPEVIEEWQVSQDVTMSPAPLKAACCLPPFALQFSEAGNGGSWEESDKWNDRKGRVDREINR